MSTPTRNTWTVPVRDRLGKPSQYRVVVEDGVILGYGPGALMMDPAEISPLRQILADAQVEAIRQRDSW